MFICGHFRRIEEDLLATESKGLAKPALGDLPQLVKTAQPFLQIDAEPLVARYFERTTFVTEVLAWSEFEKLFPAQYRAFVEANLPRIRKHVRRLIVWDAEWYAEEGDDYKLDMLFEWQIDEVLEMFGMRKTKALLREARQAAGWWQDEEQSSPVYSKAHSPIAAEEEEECFDEKQVRAEFANLLEAPESNYLDEDEIEPFIKLHIADARAFEKVVMACRSERYECFRSDRLMLSLLCKHSADLGLDDEADTLLFLLTKAELKSSLGDFASTAHEDDLLSVFGAACFEYYFGELESFLDDTIASLRSEIPWLNSLRMDQFCEFLVPFFCFSKTGVSIVSEQVGERFACRHLCGMGQNERVAFYQERFSRFSEENCAMDWWHTFLRHDRQTFIKAYVGPTGESAIAVIADTSLDRQFLTFLTEIELGFDMVFGLPGHGPRMSFEMKGGRQLDFFDYMTVGLDPLSAGEFLVNSLTESDAEHLACEVVYFKDVIQSEVALPPNARLHSIDFGKFTATSESYHIIQKLGDAFEFASKFDELRQEFGRLLADS